MTRTEILEQSVAAGYDIVMKLNVTIALARPEPSSADITNNRRFCNRSTIQVDEDVLRRPQRKTTQKWSVRIRNACACPVLVSDVRMNRRSIARNAGR
jgi:hypothetical protein